jgi:hypothetical protein
MPLGASRDLAVTKLLRTNGFFRDPRSYVSMPRKEDATVHLHLQGEDKAAQRDRVWRKHRNRCVVCKIALDPNAEKWQQFAGCWHHTSYCDCVGCSELRCDTTSGRECHGHGTAGFKRRVA